MKVAIVMGSKSDWGVMSAAVETLKDFGIENEVRIISAHRTPDLAADFARNAAANGIGVIIAGAGGAAHLGGVIAAMTNVPVIGVPIRTQTMGGLDSLLSKQNVFLQQKPQPKKNLQNGSNFTAIISG